MTMAGSRLRFETMVQELRTAVHQITGQATALQECGDVPKPSVAAFLRVQRAMVGSW